MDHAALRAEIQADPLGLGYPARVAAGDDAGLAALLNAKSYTLPWGVPWKRVAGWGAITGARAKIQDASNDVASPVRSIALSFMDSIRGSSSEYLDTTDPAVVGPGGMLDALVATGMMTAGQKAMLVSLGDVAASRAEVLWGVGAAVTQSDISFALRGTR